MPSSYINSDNIGNVYLNRLDGAVLEGEPIPYSGTDSLSGDALRELFTVKFTDTRTIWTPQTTTGGLARIGVRFPVSWETLTGDIPTPSSNSEVTNNARTTLFVGNLVSALNSSNTTTRVNISSSTINVNPNQYFFAVVNDYAFAWCTFGSVARSTCSFGYTGWLRDDSGGSGGRYTGLQFPRNFCNLGINSSHTWTGSLAGNTFRRVATENLTSVTTLYSTNDTTFNPAINCTGDSTPLIFRDSGSPFSRVGMTYLLFRIPSTCTIGQVYKLGTDPDNSNKPYVICCGNWGSFKVGMRVWADGYT